jgi:hypothetical protein
MEEMQVTTECGNECGTDGRTVNRLLHDIIDDISLSLGMVKLTLRQDSLDEATRGDLAMARDSLARACDTVRELSSLVRDETE